MGGTLDLHFHRVQQWFETRSVKKEFPFSCKAPLGKVKNGFREEPYRCLVASYFQHEMPNEEIEKQFPLSG
jgi:hypothetical protein